MNTLWIVLMSVWLVLFAAGCVASVISFVHSRAGRYGESATTGNLATVMLVIAFAFSLAAWVVS